MSDATKIEWPREIWMAERDEHDQGVVSAVLSEHATVARWEGDRERDREFHRYVDADIHESAERYHCAKREELVAEINRLSAENEALKAYFQGWNDAIEAAEVACDERVARLNEMGDVHDWVKGAALCARDVHALKKDGDCLGASGE